MSFLAVPTRRVTIDESVSSGPCCQSKPSCGQTDYTAPPWLRHKDDHFHNRHIRSVDTPWCAYLFAEDCLLLTGSSSCERCMEGVGRDTGDEKTTSSSVFFTYTRASVFRPVPTRSARISSQSRCYWGQGSFYIEYTVCASWGLIASYVLRFGKPSSSPVIPTDSPSLHRFARSLSDCSPSPSRR